MSNRPDHLTDDAITQFLRTRSADPDLGLLQDIVRTAEATPQDRPWLGLGPIQLPRRTILIVAIALLLATMGAIGVGSLLVRPDLPVTLLPTTPDAWDRVLIDTPSGTGSVASLAASPHGLLAVVEEEDGDGPTRLAVSTDGHNWASVPEDRHPALWERFMFGTVPVVGTDRGFLLLLGNEVWMSENGYDWQRLASSVTNPDVDMSWMRAATAGGPGLVAVGDDKAWYSDDGSDWSNAEVPPGPAQILERPAKDRRIELTGVAAAGDDLVAWGEAEASIDGEPLLLPMLWASSDGRAWVSVVDPLMDSLSAVAGGPAGFVAAGEAGPEAAVWFSADGEVWARVADSTFSSRWAEDSDGTLVNDDGMPVKLMLKSAAATNAGYVVVGGDGLCLIGPCPDQEAVIWTSPDGRSWSRVPSDDRFSGAWANRAVAWGSRFVVGGEYDGKPAIWISNSGEDVSGANASIAPAPAIPTPIPGQPVNLAGTWEATDFPPDSSHLTMAIVELPDDTYGVTIRDDSASVCSGVPSTMTGVAESAERGTLAIEQPEYACDDGSPAEALSGPPLEEQLRNLSFSYDALRHALFDSLGLEWTRVEVAP